jgi:hypothetical protein
MAEPTTIQPPTRRLRIIPALLVLAVTVACATTERQNLGSLSSDCMFSRGIRDYRALDNRNLIVYGMGRRPYHVVLASRSMNVEHEFTIGVYDDGDGRVCPYGRDAILIDGVIPERIQIRSIEEITADEVEALEVEYGLVESADDAVTVTEVE